MNRSYFLKSLFIAAIAISATPDLLCPEKQPDIWHRVKVSIELSGVWIEDTMKAELGKSNRKLVEVRTGYEDDDFAKDLITVYFRSSAA
jgi:hypothetical protein